MNQGESKSAWYLVGECGLDEKGEPPGDVEEYLFRLQAGLVLLKTAFGEPPSGCALDVLWAASPHGGGDFPIIAFGFDENADAAREYADRLEEGLTTIDEAVDWDRLSLLVGMRRNETSNRDHRP